jgi:hypothetical protein
MLRSVYWGLVTDVSEQSIIHIVNGKAVAWPLKMGPIFCLDTSVNNYQSTLRNIPEERKSYSYYGVSLKSYKT